MIKSLIVKDLHNQFDFELKFNEDLNIITGKNGSGKTSILKLMWYMLSGHIDLLIEELNFSYAQLTYGNHIIEVYKTEDKPKNIYRIEVKLDGNPISETQDFLSNYDRGYFPDIPVISNEGTSSIFFPTFRRIEGGFGVRNKAKVNPTLQRTSRSHLVTALSQITEQLNVDDHQFITAISTRDIQQMLLRENYDRLEKADEIQKVANQEIIEQLKISDTESNFGTSHIVNEFKQKMENIERRKEELMKPFDSLSKLVQLFFKYKGISISDNISFGEKTELLSSDKLSAGEKQMLSFLSYNAFTKDSAIFIDEPELSLHVDWQRQLLPALMEQGTKNQFFIATHSPFIYGMYPDKEIELMPKIKSVPA